MDSTLREERNPEYRRLRKSATLCAIVCIVSELLVVFSEFGPLWGFAFLLLIVLGTATLLSAVTKGDYNRMCMYLVFNSLATLLIAVLFGCWLFRIFDADRELVLLLLLLRSIRSKIPSRPTCHPPSSPPLRPPTMQSRSKPSKTKTSPMNYFNAASPSGQGSGSANPLMQGSALNGGDQRVSAECAATVFSGGFLYDKVDKRNDGAFQLLCKDRKKHTCSGSALLANDGSVIMTNLHSGSHQGTEEFNARQFSKLLHSEQSRRDYNVMESAMKDAIFGGSNN